MRAYLDHNATSPLRPEARYAMGRACDAYGNPASSHRLGRAAARIVESAREVVAAAIGAEPSEILFTSGGTEADNIAVACHGVVVAPVVEHKAVLAPAEAKGGDGGGGGFIGIAVDRRGCIPDLAGFGDRFAAACIDLQRPPLLAVMVANNEIGTLYPVGRLARVARNVGVAAVHSDAVNAFGKVPLDVHGLGVDTLALSAHKIGGPKGIGALYVRNGYELAPLCHGGGQERGLRPGTPNVIGIAGFGAAVSAAMRGLRDGEPGRLDVLRRCLDDAFGDAAFNPGPARLSNTAVLRTATHRDALVLASTLDRAGVAVSVGSACGCKRPRRSHVLEAVGVPGAVRFSLGWSSQPRDVEVALAVLRRVRR